MKQYLKKFFYLLDKPAKKTLPFLIAMFLISSLLDVIGVGLIGVFLGLLASPQFFLQKIPSVAVLFQGLSEKKLVTLFGIFIVIAFAMKAIVALAIQKRMISFCQLLAFRLKTRMMVAFQYAPYLYHLQRNSAYLISRIQDNLNNYVGNVLLPTLNLTSNCLIAIFILTLLTILHPLLTGFLIIMFLSVGLTLDLMVKKKLIAMGKIAATSSGEMIKSIHNGLNGLVEVRVLGKERYFLESISKISKESANASGVLASMQLVPRYLIENMMAIFIVGLSVIGVLVGFNTGSVIAMVGMFAAAGARLLPTITQIIATINQIRGYSHNTQLVYDELFELDQLTYHLSAGKLFSNHEEGKLPFTKIQLKKVFYQYPHTTVQTLTNVNLTILKGQSIGLIGPSGAGKSTLVNLILGFLEIEQGELLIDGNSIQNLRTWLNNFAYIPQSIFLLDDTLRRNIALGTRDENIDEARIWQAIQMAQLTDVVKNLPSGLNTLIGENGIRLSGGQRQRVALARAFYYERDIIIMDEATSSLDNETEKEVINTIQRLKGNKTLIVIAHRLTTVKHCDVLYRLEKGCITSVGSFEEVVGSTA